MSDWQPIETAPKDGTRIDVWAYWAEGDNWSRSADAYWSVEDQDWMLDRWLAGQYVTPPKITHWMPLPEPPADQAK